MSIYAPRLISLPSTFLSPGLPERGPRKMWGEEAACTCSRPGWTSEREARQPYARRGPHAPARIVLMVIGFITTAATTPACAQKLDARYVISMTGIRVGQSAWTVDISGDRYAVSASGGSVDILSVLVRGEGVAQAVGMVKEDRLFPVSFSSSVVEDSDKIDLKMTFDDGNVTAVDDHGPPAGADRVPLAPAHAQGVVDPLTALLIPNDAGTAAPGKESCNRTLAVFDGRRRYDLALSFKRMEDVRGNELGGRVLVCNVMLRPIAGHRANSMIMKYVADRRDMEISFALIAGTHFLAPIRLLVPTLIGTMAVQATQFAVSAPAPQAAQP
jgi:uncharacterized protein DUF3108